MKHDLFNSYQTFKTGSGTDGGFYSLPKLEEAGIGNISRLPVSIRVVLESVLRNFDGGRKVSEDSIRRLAAWQPNENRTSEIPFIVARVVLQDFTGVPLLVDLAAMRSAVERLGKDVGMIEPLVPVDLVIDHSVQVDYAGSDAAYERNRVEFKRNERYRLNGNTGIQRFQRNTTGHRPGQSGISCSALTRRRFFGRLSNSSHHDDQRLGIVGWGVGTRAGRECWASGYFLTPDVVGVNLTGSAGNGDRSVLRDAARRMCGKVDLEKTQRH